MIAATPAERSPKSRFAVGVARLRPALPALVIGAVLALLPFPTCVVRLVLGVPCPACGITRAVLAAAHLDWAASMHWHPLVPALLAATVGTVSAAFVTDDATWKRVVVVVTGAAGVALVVVWALRFAGFWGGPVPA